MCVLLQGRCLLGLRGGLGFLKLYWLSVYFSVVVIRCHDQNQLTEEKVVYVDLWFQGVGAHHGQGSIERQAWWQELKAESLNPQPQA